MFARNILFTLCLLCATLCALAQSRPAPANKTFTHPKGYSLQHPADWRVESNAEFAQLLPPGLTAEDQTENIRVLTEAVPVDAADPRFTAELDQLAAQLPGFSKLGTTQNYKTKSGTGVRALWAGMNQTTGQRVQLRLYATTLNGLAIVLFAAGLPNKLEAHEMILRDIAASIALPAAVSNTPQRSTPPAANDRSPLAQQWLQRLRGKKLTMLSSYNSGGGGGGMSSKTEIYLNADGSFLGRSESSVSVYVPGANGGSSGMQKAVGTWRIYAKDGQALLEIKYENGQIETNALQANGEQTFINGKRWFVTEQ
ncbi:MAG: hypothetical protein U0Y68_06550 [Blastocatellia bacterium]